MSHQFSFLQLFAGYKFLQTKLLSSYTQNIRLKSLRADLGVECHRRIEICLQTDMSKFQTHICKRFIFFQQMCFCWNISAFLTIFCNLCYLPIGRIKHFNHQYIHWLNNYSPQFPSYEDRSYIFDSYVVVLPCKYLSQLGFLNKQQSYKAIASS